MRRWIIVMGLAASLYLPTHDVDAQQNEATHAGRALGGILFPNRQRQDDAYVRGQVDGAIVAEHMAHAEQMNQEAHILEMTRQMQDALTQWMVRGGMEPGEASAIASAYRIAPEQEAIVARANRDGSKATLAAIKTAYAQYNYLLMDQLILGYVTAQQAEIERSASPPSPQQ